MSITKIIFVTNVYKITLSLWNVFSNYSYKSHNIIFEKKMCNVVGILNRNCTTSLNDWSGKSSVNLNRGWFVYFYSYYYYLCILFYCWIALIPMGTCLLGMVQSFVGFSCLEWYGNPLKVVHGDKIYCQQFYRFVFIVLFLIMAQFG